MQTIDAALDIIKSCENWEPLVYICPAGYPTIGWGHVVLKGETFPTTGKGISKQVGTRLLRRDVGIAERIIADYVSVPLTPEQHGALVSFVFNIGEGNFRTSTILKRINAERHFDAAQEFGRWIYAGGMKLNGLISRREREKDLYESDAPRETFMPLSSWIRLRRAA